MKAPPASSSHLSAFALDLHYALEQTGRFSSIVIKKTGQSQCLLEVKCSLTDASSQPSEIGELLESVWREVEYAGGENTCQIAYSQEAVELWFSTAEGVRVTGRIRAMEFKR